jgi:hypothetical protein
MTRLLPLALLLLAAPALAAPVPKVVLSAEQEKEFDDLWDATGFGQHSRVGLYCRLISQPEAAVAYLTKRLPPADLSEVDAKELLKALASNDAKVWKPAFRALAVRDVRLALSADAAWDEHDSADYRRRLGTLLQGFLVSPEEVSEEVTYSLHRPAKPGQRWMLSTQRAGSRLAFGGELQLTYTDAERSPNHYRGKRAEVAVAALERIGTPAARDHLVAVAKGHGSSPFTKGAKEAVERFERPQDPLGGTAADLWKWELEKFSAPLTIDRFLKVSNQTVPLFKEKLKPLTLSKQDGEKLLARLFSDDAKEWQGALREIAYYDLRLATTAEDAWKGAKTPTHRGRLLSAMRSRSEADAEFTAVDDEHRLFDYTLHLPHPEFNAWHATTHVRDGLSDQDAQLAKAKRKVGGKTRVDNVLTDETSKLGESRWAREESAIHILDAIGTDDAIAVIKDMATGHPDAGPTKAAKGVLKRRGVK